MENLRKKIKYSIIVPVYNVEKYLVECLDSVINQTYKNFELIIINDGSTDDSLVIANTYTKDDRVKVYSQRNKGLAQTRNVGLSLANGDYILFLDSDDYWDIDLLSKVNENLIVKECVLVIFGRYRFTDNTKIEDKITNDTNYELGIDYLEDSVSHNYFTASVANKVFKKSFLDNNNIIFIPNILYEDLFFTFKSLVEAKSIMIIDIPLYYYRWVRPGSIINSIKEKDKDVLVTINYIENYLKDSNRYGILDADYYNQLIYSWIANAVIFKYPQKYLFNKRAHAIVKDIIQSEMFNKYVVYMNSESSNFKLKITAFLALNSYPLFAILIYIYGKLKNN